MLVTVRRIYHTENEIDYSIYRMTIKEYILSIIVLIGIACIFSYVFYDNLWISIAFVLPVYFYLKLIKKVLIQRRIQKLNIQFKDFCMSMTAQLIAGYSIENSLVEVYRELSQLYGKESYICKETKILIIKLRLNITIENAIENFAIRSGIEDIKLFSEIISIAKRSGGDLIKIVKNAANSISRKIETEREIKVIINSKKYEQMIMNIIPIGIIVYVRLTSPNMMSIMYNSITGRIVMSVCLMIYVFAFFLGYKISKVEI